MKKYILGAGSTMSNDHHKIQEINLAQCFSIFYM